MGRTPPDHYYTRPNSPTPGSQQIRMTTTRTSAAPTRTSPTIQEYFNVPVSSSRVSIPSLGEAPPQHRVFVDNAKRARTDSPRVESPPVLSNQFYPLSTTPPPPPSMHFAAVTRSENRMIPITSQHINNFDSSSPHNQPQIMHRIHLNNSSPQQATRARHVVINQAKQLPIHNTMTREEAEHCLRLCAAGSYLLRVHARSQMNDEYVLSVVLPVNQTTFTTHNLVQTTNETTCKHIIIQLSHYGDDVIIGKQVAEGCTSLAALINILESQNFSKYMQHRLLHPVFPV